MRRLSSAILFLLSASTAISVLGQPPVAGITPEQTANDKKSATPPAADDETTAVLKDTDAVRSLSVFAPLEGSLQQQFNEAVEESRVSCSKAKPVVHEYLKQQFGKNGPSYAKPGEEKDLFHAIVHVWLYPSGTSEKAGDGCWFVARQTGLGEFKVSTEARILGSSNVAIVAILLGMGTGLTSDEVATSYWTLVKAKLPQNLQNLLSALRLPTIAAQGAKGPAVYHGFAQIHDIKVPSDISVVPVGRIEGKRIPLVKKPFVVDNEGRHFWDVSVGVPVTKATGLEYTETSSSFTAKEVNKQTILAMFNVIPFGYAKGTGWQKGGDLKNTKEFRPISLLAGIGITGKPGDRFFVGAGVGIGIAQVFAGSGFNSVEYKDATNPQLVRTHYRSKLVFGVNIPVGSAITKLSKK